MGATKPSMEQMPPMPEISAGDDVAKLLERYLANARAFTLGEPSADERFLRAVEWLMEVPSSRGGDARRELVSFAAALAVEGKTLAPGMNERLDAALAKLLAR